MNQPVIFPAWSVFAFLIFITFLVFFFFGKRPPDN
jgi:hypothetical protein